MSSNFGKHLKIHIFGQSHGEGLGVVVDGLPSGEALDMEQVALFLARRRAGHYACSTKRTESDMPKVLSGLWNGQTCGAPLCAVFTNDDTRSTDYTSLSSIPRPSHADYPAAVKYHGANDGRGGGHFSGRLTLPLCFAGAVCQQLLARRGVFTGAHIASIGEVNDRPYDAVNLSLEELQTAASAHFPVHDAAAGELMIEAMTEAAAQKDSLGGMVEGAVIGLPAGVGEPLFAGIENHLASVLFGIPAVKGLEFGAGFAASQMRGSQHNDAYYFDGDIVRTRTNHAGGILGGLSTGMPVIFRVAFKPTSSIGKEQQSVNLQTKEDTKLTVSGRHDPCIVPRAVVCVEAAAAVAILDLLLLQQ